jgi:hypothetical protein
LPTISLGVLFCSGATEHQPPARPIGQKEEALQGMFCSAEQNIRQTGKVKE